MNHFITKKFSLIAVILALVSHHRRPRPDRRRNPLRHRHRHHRSRPRQRPGPRPQRRNRQRAQSHHRHPTAATPRPPSPSAPTPSPRSSTASAPQHRTGIPLTVGQSKQIDLTLSLDSVAQQVTVQDTPAGRQHLHAADLRPRRRAPDQAASAQRPQLRPAHHAQSRRRQLHRPALRHHRHVELLGRQHVRHLRPPPAGQSLPAQRHRVHRRIAHQRHSRRHQRPAARRRCCPRVQRRHATPTPPATASARARRSPSSPRPAQITCTAPPTSSSATPPSTPATTSTRPHIPEFQRNNFGGSLGGPIRKDKLFLFANYEGYRQNLGLSDVTLVPDTRQVSRRQPLRQRAQDPLLAPVARRKRSRAAAPAASPSPTPAPCSTSAKTSAPRASTTTSARRSLLRRLHHRRLHRQHAHAEPALAHQREPPRAGRQRAGAACLLRATAQHRARRLLARLLLLPRHVNAGRTFPAGSQASPSEPSSSRQHRLQRLIADHRRRRQT